VSWFTKLKQGLQKSSSKLSEGLVGIFTKRKLDDAALEELEDTLLLADFGAATAATLTKELARVRFGKEISPEEVKEFLAEHITPILEPLVLPLNINKANQPHVILMIGVNGSGKTTTIGKLAAQFKEQGKSVLLVAGDTFRAAAVEQLKIWGTRANVPVLARETGSDAAALVFDALEHAKRDNIDVVLMDTAGRLQNKDNLMAELSKIRRVLQKADVTAPHDVVLVLDATTGQAAINQVEVFGKAAGVTGLIVTKLDGTARGGIVVALAQKFGLPIHALGVGEQIDDLKPFLAADFARHLVGVAGDG